MSRSDSTQTSTGRPDAAERAVRVAQLLDLYGPLLTDRQREFVELHYGQDLSFGEVARDAGVSRQAVHDAVRHAERALEDYDARLKFSPEQAPRRVIEEPADGEGSAPSAPRKVGGLGPSIRTLEEIEGRLQRSGGIIYNADGIAREISVVLGQLRELDAD